MEFTISPESIGGLGDLGYGLLGGATFDFDGTEYQIQDYDSLSEAIKEQKLKNKLVNFYNLIVFNVEFLFLTSILIFQLMILKLL